MTWTLDGSGLKSWLPTELEANSLNLPGSQFLIFKILQVKSTSQVKYIRVDTAAGSAPGTQ